MNRQPMQVTVDKFIFRVKVGYLYTEDGVWVARRARGARALG